MKKFSKSIFSATIVTVASMQSSIAAYDSAGTDYSIALSNAQNTTPWVNDRANAVVNIAETLTCIMREAGLGVDGVANRTFKAVVNEANCGINDGSRTSYAQLTITSSHADNNSPQDISAWLEQANGEKFVMQAQVSSSPTSSNPWGILNARFMRVTDMVSSSRDFDENQDMHGWFRTTTSGTDIVMESSDKEIWGNEAAQYQAKATLINGSTDDVLFVARNYESYSNNGVASTFAGKANATDLWSLDLDANGFDNTANAQCKSRNTPWTSGYKDRLFYAADTTINGTAYSAGDEVNLSGDIDFQSDLDNDGTTENGSLGFWGLWININHMADWTFPGATASNSTAGRTFQITEEYGDNRIINVTQSGGNLEALTSVSLGSDFPSALVVSGYKFDDNGGAFGTGFSYSNGVWSGTVNNAATTWTPATNNSQSGDEVAWFWTNNYPSRQFTAIADGSGGVTYTENKNARIQADHALATAQSPTRLICTSNCPVPTGTITPISSPQSQNSATQYLYNPAGASTGLPATLYYDGGTTAGSLDASDIPLVTNYYDPYPNNDELYYMFDGQTVNDVDNNDANASSISREASNIVNNFINVQLFAYSSSDCKLTNTSGCDDQDQYRWNASPQDWSQQQFAYLANDGTAVTFSTPINLSFTYDASADDKNNGVARTVTLADGSWNPYIDGQCSSNTAGSCTVDLAAKLALQVNQTDTVTWAGRSLNFQWIEDNDAGTWLRPLNPAEGEVIFTDSNNNTYVHVTSGFEMFLTNSQAGACNTIDLSANGGTPDADHTFSDIPSLGYDDDSPAPTIAWSDRPSSVDETCIIRSGEIFENGSKVTSCSAW